MSTDTEPAVSPFIDETNRTILLAAESILTDVGNGTFSRMLHDGRDDGLVRTMAAGAIRGHCDNARQALVALRIALEVDAEARRDDALAAAAAHEALEAGEDDDTLCPTCSGGGLGFGHEAWCPSAELRPV